MKKEVPTHRSQVSDPFDCQKKITFLTDKRKKPQVYEAGGGLLQDGIFHQWNS
jgi:hypothetical protein